jgi:hypothetical protein
MQMQEGAVVRVVLKNGSIYEEAILCAIDSACGLYVLLNIPKGTLPSLP